MLITIDVEDWFQVENFKPRIPFETWDHCEFRAEKNTHQLLNLFDSIKTKVVKPQYGTTSAPTATIKADRSEGVRNQKNGGNTYPTPQKDKEGHPRATFFILGWIAEKVPHLVREIHSRGHEIASHGYNHNMCNQQTYSDLRRDLTKSRKLLEDIIGSPVFGFRAPNFSIRDDVLKTIQECDYQYDSSLNSFGLHGRYGKISLKQHAKQGVAHKISDDFYELPISNLNLRSPFRCLLSTTTLKATNKKSLILPLGGGAYFRLIPFTFFKLGVQSILEKDGAYVFYLHPWEIDHKQPKVHGVALDKRFRHYTNLLKTDAKLSNLIKSFRSCQFVTCKDYLSRVKNQINDQ